MRLSPARFISIMGTEVHAAVNSPADGKAALKEIKQKKNEYALMKRKLQHQLKLAKAAAERAQGKPSARPRQGLTAMIGRLVGRVRARKPLESMSSLEGEIVNVDEILFNLDSCRVQIEGKLLHLS